MAKISMDIGGFDKLLSDIDKMSADMSSAVKESITESVEDLSMRMKRNASSSFEDSQAMVDSISHTVVIKDDVVLAQAGVFDMSNKTGTNDRIVSGRRITAPVLALMYEAGIRPHSTSKFARLADPKRKQLEMGQGGQMHQGHAPVPFLTSAFDVSSQSMFDNMLKALDAKIGAK